MNSTNFDEESSLLQADVQIEQKPSMTSTFKIAVAAVASAVLLGAACVINQQLSSGINGLSKSTDLSSAAWYSTTYYTPLNWDGQLVYLDRHNMNECGTDPMSGFRLVNRLMFMYKCNKMRADRISSYTTHTNANEGNGGIQYLDRHSAYCDSDSLMSELRGMTSGSSFYWQFVCSKYEVKQLTCEEKQTSWNEFGPWFSMIYLDRHDVNCEFPNALQGFRGETSNNNLNCRDECARYEWFRCVENRRVCDNAFRFNYKCCNAIQHDPTPSPIADPTANPVSDPTNEPIAEPTQEPIATPTEHPVAEPTKAPNRDNEIKIEEAALEKAKENVEDFAAELEKLKEKHAELQKTKDEKLEDIELEDLAGDPELTKELDELNAEIKQIEIEIQNMIKKLQNNNEPAAVLEEIKAARESAIVCPYTFKQGVSNVKVPIGCVFVASNDVTFGKQKKMDAPAVYFCQKNGEFVYHEKDFEQYGLDEGSISFIQPGKHATVQFYTGNEPNSKEEGESAIFSSDNFTPLNSFKFRDGSLANDRVKSILIKTDYNGDEQPEKCEDLTFSQSMKLNNKLLMKLNAKSNHKNKKH